MSRFLPLVLVAGLSLTPAVFAASDPMDACAKETNDAARLACFDKALAARRQAPKAPTTAPTPATPGPSSGTNVAQKPINTAPPAAPAEPPAHRAKETAFSATVTKIDARPSRGYLFVLDNGQIWETTEARSDLLLNEHDTVTIKPGGLGGFLLQNPSKQTVRIRRVR